MRRALHNILSKHKFKVTKIMRTGTNSSKINGNTKGVYLPIPKPHSILAVMNLHAHNNLWLCYYGQVNSVQLILSVASKCSSKNIWGTIYYAVDDSINIVNYFIH